MCPSGIYNRIQFIFPCNKNVKILCASKFFNTLINYSEKSIIVINTRERFECRLFLNFLAHTIMDSKGKVKIYIYTINIVINNTRINESGSSIIYLHIVLQLHLTFTYLFIYKHRVQILHIKYHHVPSSLTYIPLI